MKIPDESEADLTADTTESFSSPIRRRFCRISFRFTSTSSFTRSCLKPKPAEQSARMVAMKNATDNAKELIKDLTLEYNKVRQENITTELLEITAAQLAVGYSSEI